jgi:hypothetical protein
VARGVSIRTINYSSPYYQFNRWKYISIVYFCFLF